MRHVFVETNWVVGYASPQHHQIPAALAIAEAARRGECTLHLPAPCLAEARRAIQKFQPRREADAIRKFLQRSHQVNHTDAAVVRTVLGRYESSIGAHFDGLDAALIAIRTLPGVQVFALDETMLERSIELSVGDLSHLQAFDQAILAAILVRAERLRSQGEVDVVFCELDGDLQPWDENGDAKRALRDRFDQARVWVYRDFELSGPERPTGWAT